MSFAGKVWRLLVGIKDGLALLFLLLFFFALYALLSTRPSPAQVHEGALLLSLDGYVVEERSKIDPLQALLTREAPVGEYQVRDLVRAIDAAATDDRIKAVVLDLDRFLGGGQVHMQDIGASLDRVRAAGKPVLAYAMFYGDDSMMLAAHASEVWLNPQGGAFVAGPGGNHLYYAGLLDKLKVNAHVYRVGTYKSAVEPYLLESMSGPARENYQAIYGALWEEWQANVKKARPKAQLDMITTTPVEWVAQSKGDLGKAALAAGLVDKLGSWVEFGDRVAEVAGDDPWDDLPGAFAHTALDAWLADNQPDRKGDAIGVVTIAGEMIDGNAGPGTAGGQRISDLLDDALVEGNLKGLVIRIDSPGGTATSCEQIVQAINRHKAKGIPIAVSMANIAGSCGYWVATPGERIFAEPETITGSIGIYAVIPTFERAASALGVNADGVRTSPLSGQPDMVGGFTPEMDAILQSTIEGGYADFLDRVAKSRKMTPEAVDAIGQGRVWDGGTARQIGLVDQYGGLDDALAWVAGKAGLAEGKWHADFLGESQANYDSLLWTLIDDEESQARGGDLFARIAWRQQMLGAQMASDLDRLLGGHGAMAYCLECPALPAPQRLGARFGMWEALAARLLAQ